MTQICKYLYRTFNNIIAFSTLDQRLLFKQFIQLFFFLYCTCVCIFGVLIGFNGSRHLQIKSVEINENVQHENLNFRYEFP